MSLSLALSWGRLVITDLSPPGDPVLPGLDVRGYFLGLALLGEMFGRTHYAGFLQIFLHS